ncbi:MAG: SAM-dependent methyltransferase [Planctomycetota bacterium]|jgi:SAM-dependent methyltransferase
MATSFQTLDWYDAPKYYDIIFDVETEEEADFLEAVHEALGPKVNGRSLPRALEPACGSGRLVVELADRGWRVEGNDISQPMLDYARERLRSKGLLRRARLSQGDMSHVSVKQPVHLAHCGVSTFKYLLDETSARSHLASVAGCLAPGGLYLLGFHLTNYETSKESVERWRVEQDGLDVRCSIRGWPADKRKRREKVRSRLRVVEDGQQKRSETEWYFRTYNARQVRNLLRAVPELEHIASFDFTYDIEAPRKLDDEYEDIVLVLRKRE